MELVGFSVYSGRFAKHAVCAHLNPDTLDTVEIEHRSNGSTRWFGIRLQAEDSIQALGRHGCIKERILIGSQNLRLMAEFTGSDNFAKRNKMLPRTERNFYPEFEIHRKR